MYFIIVIVVNDNTKKSAGISFDHASILLPIEAPIIKLLVQQHFGTARSRIVMDTTK